MNDYQKAIKRGIETGLDNHFSKKESKKVWLTVEEAKVIEELALLCLFLRPKAVTIEKAKVMKELNNRIEQAEKGHETE